MGDGASTSTNKTTEKSANTSVEEIQDQLTNLPPANLEMNAEQSVTTGPGTLQSKQAQSEAVMDLTLSVNQLGGIKELDFTGIAPLTAEDGRLLGGRLNLCANLEKLDLSRVGMSDEACRWTFSTLDMGALASLEKLYLTANQISDAGFTSLAVACAEGGLPRLEELDVRNNQIGDVGLASLADACIKGGLPQLRDLLVVFNHFTIHGFNALTDAMSKGKLTELRHLHVHCNGLESPHYRELFDQCGYSLAQADRYALTTAMSEFGCAVKLVVDMNPFMQGGKRVRVVAGEEDVAAVYSFTKNALTDYKACGDLRTAITGVVSKSHHLHAPVVCLVEVLLHKDGAHPYMK